MRKEGRLKEAIDMLELAGKNPSYMLKAQAQIGLCHRSMGDYGAAIQAFRAALSDQSASRKEAIDVQYFLARTLESVGQIAEAATLYRRIAQMNPRFKDAAYRAKELSSKPKHPANGKRGMRATGLGLAMPSRVSTSLSAVASSESADPVHSSRSHPTGAFTIETTLIAQYL